jgi:hypothetical protein
MLLGGVTIEERRVRQLARIVEEPLGAKLEHALRFRASVVGVTSDERAKILKALENAPDLQEVRELLLADEKWRPNRRLA